MRHVDLDLLRTFQAVVETGSFASAAEQLGCTQPAVSLQVKRLETMFGQTLIERARPARATEPGQTVLGYARRMLRLNDELLGRFDNAREGVVLRVGIPNDFSVAMLPTALSRFAASEPGVILDLQSDLSTALLEGLRTGQFDLVVAMTTERVSDLAVKTWTERLVWIAAPDQKPTGDRPLPLICYPEGCVYRARMLKRLAEDGLQWRIAMTSSSFTSIIVGGRIRPRRLGLRRKHRAGATGGGTAQAVARSRHRQRRPLSPSRRQRRRPAAGRLSAGKPGRQRPQARRRAE